MFQLTELDQGIGPSYMGLILYQTDLRGKTIFMQQFELKNIYTDIRKFFKYHKAEHGKQQHTKNSAQI